MHAYFRKFLVLTLALGAFYRQRSFTDFHNDLLLFARNVRVLFATLTTAHITRPPRFVCCTGDRRPCRCLRFNKWCVHSPISRKPSRTKENAPASSDGREGVSGDRERDYSAPRNASRSLPFPSEKSMLK